MIERKLTTEEEHQAKNKAKIENKVKPVTYPQTKICNTWVEGDVKVGKESCRDDALRQ